jgi:hypothetical protein
VWEVHSIFEYWAILFLFFQPQCQPVAGGTINSPWPAVPLFHFVQHQGNDAHRFLLPDLNLICSEIGNPQNLTLSSRPVAINSPIKARLNVATSSQSIKTHVPFLTDPRTLRAMRRAIFWLLACRPVNSKMIILIMVGFDKSQSAKSVPGIFRYRNRSTAVGRKLTATSLQHWREPCESLRSQPGALDGEARF